MPYALVEAFTSIRDFMEAGGSVLWLIAVLVFFMWGMFFERTKQKCQNFVIAPSVKKNT